MSKENYFAHDAISRGDLLNFLQSSNKGAVNFRKEIKKDTAAMNFGRAFHSYMELGDDALNDDIYILDESQRPEPTKDYRNKANKEWKKEEIDIASEYDSIINVEDFNNIYKMSNSIKNTLFYKKAFNEVGTVEFEREFYAEIGGIEFKCIVDVSIEYEDRIVIIDWKTTDANLSADDLYNVKHEVYKWNLDVQNTHYKKVVAAATKKEVVFCFMFVEKEAPFEAVPVVFGTGSDFDMRGEMLWNRCVANYKEFKEGNLKTVADKLEQGILFI
jgi:hypothetical protein